MASEKKEKPQKPPPHTNYKTFILHGHRFSVGDDVLVMSGDGGDFIAKLDKIYTNKDGEVFIDSFWYYKPEDVKGGRQPWHGQDEIIESDHKDTYHVRCVNSLCKVLSRDEYMEKRRESASSKKEGPMKEIVQTSRGGNVEIPVYFCRSYYFHKKGTFKDPSDKTPVDKMLRSPQKGGKTKASRQQATSNKRVKSEHASEEASEANAPAGANADVYVVTTCKKGSESHVQVVGTYGDREAAMRNAEIALNNIDMVARIRALDTKSEIFDRRKEASDDELRNGAEVLKYPHSDVADVDTVSVLVTLISANTDIPPRN